MTIEAHTIGGGSNIKTATHYCSERPLGRDHEYKESYTNPDDKGLSLHWYAIEMHTGSRVEEAH